MTRTYLFALVALSSTFQDHAGCVQRIVDAAW